MDRRDLERVNNFMGRLHRLEAGVKAIVHDTGEPILYVRKGNADIETGIPVSTKRFLPALLKDIDDLWAVLEALGVPRSPPQGLTTEKALKKAYDELDPETET